MRTHLLLDNLILVLVHENNHASIYNSYWHLGHMIPRRKW